MAQFLNPIQSNTREARDQPLITAIANEFLTSKDKRALSALLGKAPDSLLYDMDEYRVLLSRVPSQMFGGQPEPQGYPFMALYQFCFTVDYVLSRFRSYEFQVSQLDSLPSIENKIALDRRILAADFRLWEFHDLPAGGYPYRPSASGDGKDVIAGAVLGSKMKWDGAALVAKEPVDFAHDERMMTAFELLNYISALSQGQYRFFDGQKWDWSSSKLGQGARKLGTVWQQIGSKDSYLKAILNSATGAERKYTTAAETDGPDQFIGGALARVADDGSEIKWSTLVAAMEKKEGLEFCPRLAKAFVESKASFAMNQRWFALQQQYTQKRQTTTLGIDYYNPMQMLQNRNKLDGYKGTFNCGPGMTPRFIGHDGSTVPESLAIIERNGRKFINTALVDPDRSYCDLAVPLSGAGYGALSVSPAQVAGRKNRGGVPFDASAMTLAARDALPRESVLLRRAMQKQDEKMAKMEARLHRLGKKKRSSHKKKKKQASVAKYRASGAPKHRTKKSKSKKSKSGKGKRKGKKSKSKSKMMLY